MRALNLYEGVDALELAEGEECCPRTRVSLAMKGLITFSTPSSSPAPSPLSLYHVPSLLPPSALEKDRLATCTVVVRARNLYEGVDALELAEGGEGHS